MTRRDLLGLLASAPVFGSVLAACDDAMGQDGPWPGPTAPRSYRTDPPPAVGDRLVLSDEEWRRRLTRDQYGILRAQRTEPSFSCELWQEHREGRFYCGGCGAPLFSSRHKFESGTGWASFFQPIESGRVSEHRDASHGMVRTEVRCARCDGHLGHVFDDGPPPTGLRYCINGSILEFVPGAA
jgi:peptide-methionine (R)-S-oxide reductase